MVFDAALFKNIFMDGHIVDINFSYWDQRISIMTIGSAFSDQFKKRLPIFNVHFFAVSKICGTFTKDARNGAGLDSKEHMHWRTHASSVVIVDEILQCSIWGMSNMPKLDIKCDSIKIVEVDPFLLDESSPGWSRPRSPLARFPNHIGFVD